MRVDVLEVLDQVAYVHLEVLEGHVDAFLDGVLVGHEVVGVEVVVASQDLVYLMGCLLYTSPSPRDLSTSRMPSSA